MDRLRERVRRRLDAHGFSEEKIVEVAVVRPRWVEAMVRLPLFLSGYLMYFLLFGDEGIFEDEGPGWRGGVGILLAVLALVWVLMPLRSTLSKHRVRVPNPAVLVLTDTSLRMYRWWGARLGVRQLMHTWGLDDVVAVKGTTQELYGRYKMYRVAVHLAGGGVLVVDAYVKQEVLRLSGLAGALHRASSRNGPQQS